MLNGWRWIEDVDGGQNRGGGRRGVDGGEENSIEFGGENSVVENLAVDGGRKYFGKNRGGGRGLSCTAGGTQGQNCSAAGGGGGGGGGWGAGGGGGCS